MTPARLMYFHKFNICYSHCKRYRICRFYIVSRSIQDFLLRPVLDKPPAGAYEVGGPWVRFEASGLQYDLA